MFTVIVIVLSVLPSHTFFEKGILHKSIYMELSFFFLSNTMFFGDCDFFADLISTLHAHDVHTVTLYAHINCNSH